MPVGPGNPGWLVFPVDVPEKGAGVKGAHFKGGRRHRWVLEPREREVDEPGADPVTILEHSVCRRSARKPHSAGPGGRPWTGSLISAYVLVQDKEKKQIDK